MLSGREVMKNRKYDKMMMKNSIYRFNRKPKIKSYNILYIKYSNKQKKRICHLILINKINS